MAKVARVGKREEVDFAEEARTWAGIRQRKLPQERRFHSWRIRDPGGATLEPRMLVDNKDKAVVAESDIGKLVRDAKERSTPVAVLVAREKGELRSVDKEARWACKDGSGYSAPRGSGFLVTSKF